MFLPVHAAAAAATRRAPARSPAPRPVETWGTGTILLVEDEDMVRAVAERALTRQGYTVLTAENGEAALELIERSGRPDLLISDVVMPGMDGPTMVRHVRERWPDLPILFMSGYAEEQLRKSIDLDNVAFHAQAVFGAAAGRRRPRRTGKPLIGHALGGGRGWLCSAADTKTAAMSGPNRILLVEDEPLIAMMLEDFLDVLGKQVAGTADNVAEAMLLVEGGGGGRRDPRSQSAWRREEHCGGRGVGGARHPVRVRDPAAAANPSTSGFADAPACKSRSPWTAWKRRSPASGRC